MEDQIHQGKRELLSVRESTIEGAGDGLFLEPQKEVVPKGTRLCVYMDRFYARPNPNSSNDYLISREGRGQLKQQIDAEQFHDIFLGPKANDRSFFFFLFQA